METYALNVAGLKRDLPIVRINDKLQIASFVMLGDTELVEKTAKAIFEHKDFPRYNIDIIVCPEAKAIPLAHSVANLLGVNYVVIRKSIKSYMENPYIESVKSITTSSDQFLVINGIDAENLRGRNICIVDDVVSTGGSIDSIEKMLSAINCKIVCKAAVLLEGNWYTKNDLVYLEKLSVFEN
jgi:adenine phosphoribosyltransferase